jgi:hypothetical protein
VVGTEPVSEANYYATTPGKINPGPGVLSRTGHPTVLLVSEKTKTDLPFAGRAIIISRSSAQGVPTSVSLFEATRPPVLQMHAWWFVARESGP